MKIDQTNRTWSAQWIWAQNGDGSDSVASRIVYFRRAFYLPPSRKCRLIVDVSASSRYRLYLNGEPVAFGPCPGDRWTQYYETVDLSSMLREGGNVLAAKVLHYGEDGTKPLAIIGAPVGGFLLEGHVYAEEGLLESLSTNDSWRCLPDEAVGFQPQALTVTGGLEEADGGRLPHGWQRTDYDDSRWSPAEAIGESPNTSVYGIVGAWPLAPRPIPLPFEHPRAFARVVRSEGIHDDRCYQAIISGGTPLVLPARSKVSLELDAGELVNGFLRIATESGGGSEIRLLCSESYVDGEGRKGNRDDHEGKGLCGGTDSYRVGGADLSEREEYETFDYRTFRFVRLVVEVAETPLTLCSIDYRDTGYPLEIKASFACSDETFAPMWDISIRTLRRCMFETYIDCPYYERLQYIMDTRLQALFTYRIGGDDRLARKAIDDFHKSMLPNGMLQSRFPSNEAQVIPGFALHWVMMVHDHYAYWGDASLVRRYRPTIDAVLDWFERSVTDTGLAGPAPSGYWSYVDWVREWEESKGVPAPGQSLPLTVYNFMYANALQQAALLNEATGRTDTGKEYRIRASRTIDAVKRHCWSQERALFQDAPSLDQYSQHAQLWAILANAVEGKEAVRLAESMLDENSLAKVSYAMAFFLFRAASAAGIYDRTVGMWDLWREQIGLGLTTWLEDPVSQRSDCHGWGASPLYECTGEWLGVKPGAPGYERILIQPRIGSLTWAKGGVSTPHGVVNVAWELDERSGKFRLRASGLRGKPTEIRLPDGTKRLFERTDEIHVVADLQEK
ncbi:alpha-L-rhamnosidase C-terminal domain-containing protein [Cohnella hashimotonis]|uniref:Alpha-L-rhamnosidase C-terminal domain-containing protein n=1 Tax=Cohnella hashimotonis TaxID=2826895 RepID=A0ABT6TM92_9BACL|nr:alpha-L-rhamnosidase C-terminal domain-containing protein [Cohnella hashimotonis]MDI4647925.1 alpha-L-rhamnosidase C-terminal domain-containing protein [Cohnella hashimotonis]